MRDRIVPRPNYGTPMNHRVGFDDIRIRMQSSCRVVRRITIILRLAERVDARPVLEEECTGAEITVNAIRLSPLLALELVRHTLPFLVLNLTRCSPRVMFYSPRSAPSTRAHPTVYTLWAAGR